MKVRLGRRVFDDGALPIMATVRPGLPGGLDAAGPSVAAGAEVIELAGCTAPHVADLVAAARSRFPGVAVAVRAVDLGTAETAMRAGADLLAAAADDACPPLARIAASGGTGGAGFVVTSPALAAAAVTAGVRRDGVLVDVPAPVRSPARAKAALTGTGWPTLVTLPEDGSLAETLTMATICAWLGARMFRTTRVPELRQALDMVASIRGAREPALTRRGLA